MMHHSIKILWIHPQLRDYRKPLFDRMNDKYHISFIFNRPNKHIKNKYKTKYLNELNIKNFGDYWKEIKNHDVIISSFTWRSKAIIIISKMLSKKIIIWEEKWFWKNTTLKEHIKNNLCIFLSKLVNAYFIMGNAQREGLEKIGISSNKMFQANEYTPYILSQIQPKRISNFSYLKDKFVILYFGRFVDVKGIRYLLDAYKKLQNNNNIYLLLVGYGELKNSLISYASKLNLRNVIFHPPVFDIKEKAFIFKEIADIAVIPSVVSRKNTAEGGPIVTVEFLSAGLPVILTDATGNAIDHIATRQSGILVPEKNSDALAEAMFEIYTQKFIYKKENVLKHFQKIKGYDYQVKILSRAIEYVSNKN